MKYLLLSLAVFLVTKSIITTIIVDKTVSGTFNIAIAPKVVITENRLLRSCGKPCVRNSRNVSVSFEYTDMTFPVPFLSKKLMGRDSMCLKSL